MSDHVAQIAKAGPKGSGLWAAWCRCGFSTPLTGPTEEHAREIMTTHFIKVGGGRWKHQ